MKCSRCGHENPEGSKFCAQCGNQLARVCPVCSTPARPDDKFCSNCGNKLTQDTSEAPERDHTRYAPEEMLDKITEARSGRAMQGERRTVTMLFADIKGSTAVAETLDPEDWADIINGAFEHLIAPVYRYEGTLARLQGDAVLAFFGAPIAHEDDPIRAVRAGLDIVRRLEPYKAEMAERWNIPIDVRVGINTGLVVVGAVGSDLKVEYTALGDAVNVAARMEQTAEPGTVRVTGETWDLVSDHFEGEELGLIEVKGKAEPVPAVRVISYQGSVPEAPQEQPLIGRSGEIADLENLRDRLAEGAGWIASVMGEAGVGKTRILDEFRTRSLDTPGSGTTHENADELGWISAFSQSYDSSVPYSTIKDLLVRWLELDDADDPYQHLDEIAASMVSETVQDPAFYLGYATGIPLPDDASELIGKLEPPVLHKRTREAVGAYLEAEAERRPVIVAFEDAHWADTMSLALIEDLMEITERAPLGLLVSMRPYRDEPVWRVHEVAERDHPHRYRPVNLNLLGEEETEELLDALVEGMTLSEETRRTILERAGGNPLFVDQMARAIRESQDDGDLAVPTGLTSLLTARLDRLDEDSRRVAQTASVIGSEFDRATLAALLGDDLDLAGPVTDLLRRGIFVEQPHATGILGFHHALVQDAAYSTMLLRTRRELHREVAEHLIRVSPGSSQEIAQHFIQAGAEEDAFPHLVAAGESSSQSMALSDAIRFFTTALEHIPADADPDLVVRAHDGLGVAYSLIPDLTQSGAAYQRLVDYADSADNPSAKVKALNRLAINTAMLAGDLEGAHRYLEDAYAIAKESGDQFGLAEYHMNACVISGLGGDISSSIKHDEKIAEQGTTLGVDAIRVEGLGRLAGNSVWLMDFDRAEQAVEDAIKAAEEIGDTGRLATVKVMGLSRLRMREGDTESALRLLLDSEEELLREASFYAPMAGIFAGTLLYDLGDIETGISRIADIRRTVIDLGVDFHIAVTSATLARMYGSLHIDSPLAEYRRSALEAVQAPLGNYLASTVWVELGRANLAMGDHQAAEEDFATGLATSSATQYWERPRLLIGRALAGVARDDLESAGRDLDEAETIIQEKELRLYEGDLRHARGKLLLAKGRPNEAISQLELAASAADSAGFRPLMAQIEVTAAQAAALSGDDEAADRHAAAARAVADSAASSVIDDELRNAVKVAWLDPLDQPRTG